MTPSFTQHEEYLTLDGPFGPPMVIACGLVLLGLFAWTLWRERSILGIRQFVVFWCLRAAALATVVWMLLAPVNVRVETSTARKAVAIFTDVSASMQTVDPPGTSDDLRWAISLSDARQPSATQFVDRAITAVGIARQRLREAIDALQNHQPEGDFVDAALTAQTALQRARRHLQGAIEVMDESSEVRGRARRLAGRLEGPEFLAFDQLCAAFRRGKPPAERSWRESLPDLELQIAAIRQPLLELSRLGSTDELSRVAQHEPAILKAARSRSRLGRAAARLDRLRAAELGEFAEQADIVWNSFDEAVRRVGDGPPFEERLAPSRDELPAEAGRVAGTDLTSVFDALQQLRESQPLAAAIVFTDAAHNRPGAPAPREVAARLADTPVHFVPIGNTEHVKDVVLQNVSAPDVAMRNDDIVIEVNLQTYDCRGEVCTVTLLQDGEIVDFREVALDSDFANDTVRFERKVRSAGLQRFQVAVEPIPGELTEQNNYDEFEVNVTRSDINILLADELPRWEYRYLAQLFRRDAKMECDELLFHPRLIATGRREASRTVPVEVDDWDQYDVVILGDLPPAHLPVAAQQALVEYLQVRGGTLVLVAGTEAMPQAYRRAPLEDVLPVQPLEAASGPAAPGYAFRLTPEGQDHPALMIAESDQATQIAWDFVNQFSPLHAVSQWRRPRPTAHTLIAAVQRNSLDEQAEAERSAFLCWQPIGRGRIIYLSGPETYRLRFLRGDQFHHRFWGQLLRWAIAADMSAGSERVRIRTDQSRYVSREIVHVSVELSDADGRPVAGRELQARITSADREQVTPLVPSDDVPGRYGAEVAALPPGVYRVEPFGAAVDLLQDDGAAPVLPASFTVSAELPQELTDTRCNRALVQQLADLTGGQVLSPTAVAEVLELTNLEPIVTETIERKPLWVQWKYLWIVFGCLQAEWIIRKWKGWS